jgi:molybdopterin molybdotransferase
MLEFEEALRAILSRARPSATEKVLIDNSIGRVLMEDIYSMIEMPPFNKSAMDGYAVKVSDIKDAPVKLRCVGSIQAGEVFKKRIKNGECVKIMTGAAVPPGADGVVMVEDTRFSGDHAEFLKPLKRWRNICFQGEDIRRGKRVLRKGRIISVSDIALLATIGRRFVKTVKTPEVAVLSTGGEIVPPGERLSKRKIYNSNGPQLATLLRIDGFACRFLGIACDEPAALKKAITKGLKSDVLLISGGVSMGDYDLVPAILKELGVKKVLHTVRTKPGKPLFFGTQKSRVVFGIPGNPVANFLAYQIYIRPALCKASGRRDYGPRFREGVIKETFRHKTGRKHFVLAKAEQKRDGYYLAPVKSHGSADILALSRADSFMVVDADRRVVRPGSKIKFITW